MVGLPFVVTAHLKGTCLSLPGVWFGHAYFDAGQVELLQDNNTYPLDAVAQ